MDRALPLFLLASLDPIGRQELFKPYGKEP